MVRYINLPSERVDDHLLLLGDGGRRAMKANPALKTIRLNLANDDAGCKESHIGKRRLPSATSKQSDEPCDEADE